MDVPIVATGVANSASVIAWLSRAGLSPRLTADPTDVRDAPIMVLPGVGAFGAAMSELADRRLIEPLRRRVESGRPLLAICLGMQLLFEWSEEGPGVRGLGVVDGSVRRLPPDHRVPHMGWNRVLPDGDDGVVPAGFAYFANSFAAASVPEGWRAATTRHARAFVSAIERGPIVACQFHPELSSAYGGDLLRRWLSKAAEVRQC